MVAAEPLGQLLEQDAHRLDPSGNASTIRSASTCASAVVHSANRTRMRGPGRLRSAAAVNVAWATSSGVKPSWAARRSVSATMPARASDPAPHRRAIHDPCPGAVAADDVARVGEAAIDRPDGVGVHPQRGPELSHGRETGAGLEAPGLDLVGELPVDLGADRDVGVALDVELVAACGAARRRLVAGRGGPIGGRGRVVPTT